MEKIKKLKIIMPAIFILGLLSGYIIFKSINSPSEETKNIIDNYTQTSLSEAGSVSCIFERTAMVSYNGSAIEYGPIHKESSSLSFSFVGIDTDTPTLFANGTAGTKYQSGLKVLSDTEEKIVLSEVTPTDGNVFIYTIYKNSGVAIWTKQYSLMGIPAGIMSMGKCNTSASKTVKNETTLSQQEKDKELAELKAFMEARKEKEMGATKADEYLSDTQNNTNEVNASEKTWKTILKINGSTSGTSKPFDIASKNYKVLWKYNGGSMFTVGTKNVGGKSYNDCGPRILSGNSEAYMLCDNGPGTFYLDISNIEGNWDVEVQE